MKWLKKFRNKNKEAIQEVKDTSKEISTAITSNIPAIYSVEISAVKIYEI